MTRGYGLPYDLASRLVAEKELADYFESMVFMVEHPFFTTLWLQRSIDDLVCTEKNVEKLASREMPDAMACAKFLLNEVTGAANRVGKNFTDVPVCLATLLLIGRKNGLINNQKIKEIFAEHLNST